MTSCYRLYPRSPPIPLELDADVTEPSAELDPLLAAFFASVRPPAPIPPTAAPFAQPLPEINHIYAVHIYNKSRIFTSWKRMKCNVTVDLEILITQQK